MRRGMQEGQLQQEKENAAGGGRSNAERGEMEGWCEGGEEASSSSGRARAASAIDRVLIYLWRPSACAGHTNPARWAGRKVVGSGWSGLGRMRRALFGAARKTAARAAAWGALRQSLNGFRLRPRRGPSGKTPAASSPAAPSVLPPAPASMRRPAEGCLLHILLPSSPPGSSTPGRGAGTISQRPRRSGGGELETRCRRAGQSRF